MSCKQQQSSSSTIVWSQKSRLSHVDEEQKCDRHVDLVTTDDGRFTGQIHSEIYPISHQTEYEIALFFSSSADCKNDQNKYEYVTNGILYEYELSVNNNKIVLYISCGGLLSSIEDDLSNIAGGISYGQEGEETKSNLLGTTLFRTSHNETTNVKTVEGGLPVFLCMRKVH